MYPVLEEVHGIVCLSDKDSNKILHSQDSTKDHGSLQSFPIIIAGALGILRIFKIELLVSNVL